ncbi:aminoacetone oxidase family FAD-binding enzyme [Candidatus Jorgensenbacteria bacterium]|nr:aminoacetone oxidase family FAD-binding enzyme [Candidatus Jorgensenbacteria bacterium]
MTGHKNIFDVIVIGGGASGMMAAGRAAERGKRVLLLEKNRTLGKKLSISGGGRCNIMNAESNEDILLSHYGKAKPFLHSPFSKFGMKNAVSFFESRGLKLKVEGQKRLFPETDNANDVVWTLKGYMAEGKVEVGLGIAVHKVFGSSGHIEKVATDKGDFFAKSYILATGGASHPETGSTSDGFTWLEDLGHKVGKPTPTIVPLRTKETWVKKISGTSLSGAKITFFAGGVKKMSRTGNVLFTHFGISGPVILNSAGKVADFLHEGVVTAHIDAFPATDIGTFDRTVRQVFDSNKNKLFKNIAKQIAPAGIRDVLLLLQNDVSPETKVHSITKEQRRKIVNLLKNIPLTITGLMGFDRAVVADGGLILTEVDTRTMRSNRYDNLFVTGDLLHINRPSGGYSLQLCWTTGYVAGSYA